MMARERRKQISSSRVIVVDDNEAFRVGLREFLEKQKGIEVIDEAKSAMEAVQLTHSLHPDIVLLDISMPGMSGLETAKQIKGFSPDTKIVFVSIHEDATFRTVAESLHVDGYVCKSSLREDLPKVLQEITHAPTKH